MKNGFGSQPCIFSLAVLSTLFLLLPFQSWAQDFDFERIPNELGLSQNLITKIYQDRQDFLWVGTRNGLNRYDGQGFRVFQHDPFDSSSLTHDNISSILEDRSGRLWVGTENGLNVLDRNREKFYRLPFPKILSTPDSLGRTSSQNVKSHHVSTLLEDRSGNIWVGLRTGDLLKIPPSTNDSLQKSEVIIFTPSESERGFWGNPIKQLVEDAQGKIWIQMAHTICLLSVKDGAYSLDELQRQDINSPRPESQPNYLPNLRQANSTGAIVSMFQDYTGAMWVVSDGGFAKWRPTSKDFTFYPISSADKAKRSISPLNGCGGIDGFIDRRGQIWVNGTENLVVYDTLSRRLMVNYHRTFPTTPNNFKSGVRSMQMDKFGNIWIGTNGLGLYRYAPHKKLFSGSKTAARWSGESIRAICQTDDGDLWLGTASRRLVRLDGKSLQPKVIDYDNPHWPKKKSGIFDQVFRIKKDQKGQLWVAASQGLFRIKNTSGELVNLDYYPIYPNKSDYPNVLDIHIDSANQIWLLTYKEFGRFDPLTRQFEGQPYLSVVNEKKERDNNFPCIHQQQNGIFWLGFKKGLLRFDPTSKQFKHYTTNTADQNSLSHPLIKYIQADPKDPDRILWVGTGGGGLNRFDLQTETFKHYKTEDGLPDNVVYAALDDDEGNLWISTNQGISKFNPKTEVFKNYNSSNGLQDDEFNTSAYYKSENGTIILGGINGFNAFQPNLIDNQAYAPRVTISDFKIANRSVDFNSPASPLKKPIAETKELVLSRKESIFSFELAALDFTEPSQNQYAYLLENFDTDWQHIGTQRTVTFTNLDPGDYKLRVKATNYDGIWSDKETQLSIIILPPWWATWWAYLTYTLLAISLIYGIYRFQLKRKLAMAEAERLKELDAFKTNLYTNITHEFRTPLTTILGMAQQIGQQPNIAAELISRNGRQLLKLVNELLDLSKLESGKTKLKPARLDVIQFLKYVAESFQSLASTEGIRLTVHSEVKELLMDVDKEKLKQIVSNVLFNAIKYTKANGEVSLTINELTKDKNRRGLLLSIADSGIGIPEEHLNSIFERFYQVDGSGAGSKTGTGIGLALTKELVKLMEGKIEVNSEIDLGSEFKIWLPIKSSLSMTSTTVAPTDATVPSAIPLPVTQNPTSEAVSPDKPLLLIVEDNLDVVTYLKICLAKDYNLRIVHDGQAGIDTAVTLVPDLIVSDVMMPQKDGFELTQTLKTDSRTSHIPIILLTAKATDQARITGLRHGADAYLLKPFNQEELNVRLKKMLELRRSLQKYYTANLPAFLTKVSAEKSTSLDEQFLQRIGQITEARIDDAALDVEDLCLATHLSTSQLNRKMKALTGMPPMRFIRKIRLHKARAVLENSDHTVAEIAYQFGFSDPNYFSRVFKKEFGHSPAKSR